MFRKCEVCVDLFEIPLIHNGDQPIAFSKRRTCSKECHLYLRGCKIANAHLEAQKDPEQYKLWLRGLKGHSLLTLP